MSVNLIKNSFNILLAALVLSFAGCTTDLYNPEPTPTPAPTPDGVVFDFSTRKAYTLNVKYDVPAGYIVSFEVYTQNPITTNEAGYERKRTDLKPIDVGRTDATGKYSFPISIPAGVSKVYIYTANSGATQLMTAAIIDGQLSDAEIYSEGKPKTKTTTRAAVEYGYKEVDAYSYPDMGKTTLLGKWQISTDQFGPDFPGLETLPIWGQWADIWGRPSYMKFVDQRYFTGDPKLVVDEKVWKTIDSALPGGGKVSQDIVKSGDIHVTKDAELNLFFLSEACLFRNTLAYYCYKTGNAPTNKSDIKIQTIAFPLANKFENQAGDNYGALIAGEGIQLHYFDEKGVDQGLTFPAGTSIGWILYSNGFRKDVLFRGNGAIYSTPGFNQKANMAVFRHGDFVITSFEDEVNGGDQDFDDLIFHVQASPAESITPGIPDVDPDKEPDPVPATAAWDGTLAFEDLWPRQADFDMNDVVVKYTTEVKYAGDQLQLVDQVTVKYKLLWSGATIHSAFAVQFPGDVTVSVDGTLVNLDDTRSVILFDDALTSASALPEKIVTVKYKTPIAKSLGKGIAGNINFPPFNPYIVQGKKEIHLTGYNPTSAMDMKLFTTADDKSDPSQNIWYITYVGEQQLPFAIDVPFDGVTEYVICPESHRIDTAYPTFMNWIKTNGKENADWYLNPKK